MWSRSGDKPDLILPGTDIYSCVPPGLAEFGGASYCYMDGTSFAAPHLSAIVALLMQAHPRAEPWRIVQALKCTADGYPSYDDRRGGGMPVIERALDDLSRSDRN